MVTIAEVDEALARLATELADARRNNLMAREVVLTGYVDRFLDERLELAQPCASP